MKRLIPANVLGLVSGCLMVVSMLLPWWRIVIMGRPGTNVYPYGISGAAAELLGYKRSTQMIILTCILIICIVLCFVGSALKGGKGRATLGAVGIFALLAALGLVLRIYMVCKRFGIPIQGDAIRMAYQVRTGFQAGLYLIILAGLLCLVSSALHERLLHRP